jgi:hypothetical protein
VDLRFCEVSVTGIEPVTSAAAYRRPRQAQQPSGSSPSLDLVSPPPGRVAPPRPEGTRDATRDLLLVIIIVLLVLFLLRGRRL